MKLHYLHERAKQITVQQVKDAQTIKMPKNVIKPNKKIHHSVEDLRAFERRFTEVIASYEPKARRWRFAFAFVVFCAVCGFFYWILDPDTQQVSLYESLICRHPLFSAALITMGGLLVFGYHNLIVAPQILTERMRGVLQDYNLSCDENGKIILKPIREAKID